ncbi:MAG: tetratricopeptide repeat protein [Acidobacteriota bacterium]
MATDDDASGTLAYMSPEQALRRPADARSDLYALGCILYEIVTGRPPFFGETAAEILDKHLRSPPVPPSALVPGVPTGLDDVILRLLAKSPRDRPGHAGLVAAALASIGVENGGPAGPPARAYLYRPELSGRAAILATLADPLGDLDHASRARLFLVAGESGVGKTRLLVALSAEARRRRVAVIGCECLPRSRDTAGPLSALARLFVAIADRCRERGAEETERLLGRRGRILAPCFPELLELPGQAAHADLAELPAEAARHRLVMAAVSTIRAMAAASPLCLFVDDLQWADDVSHDVLARLAGAAMPVIVIGGFRAEERTAEIDRLIGLDAVRHFRLDRLGEDAVRAMVADMLGVVEPPPNLVAFVARASEGNPFFVAEYLRAGVDGSVLQRDARGRWSLHGEADPSRLPLPASLSDLVARRLAALSPPAARLLDVAAAMGREADVAILADASLLPEPELLSAHAELVARQILDDAPGGKARFTHDKILETAFSRIDPATLRPLHRAIAEALERAGGDRHAALGRHWEAAGDPGRAHRHYLAGARAATRRFASTEAKELYVRALGLPLPPSTDRLKARVEVASQIHATAGHMDDARIELERALHEARALCDRSIESRALLELAFVAVRTGDLAEARIHARQLRDRLPESDLERADALAGLALCTQYLDGGPSALPLYEESARLLADTAHEDERTKIMVNHAVCLMDMGRAEEASTMFESALATARRAGHRRIESTALSNMGVLAYHRGKLQDALSLYELSAAIVREIGDRYFEGIVLGNIGEVHALLGHATEARHGYEQALLIHRETGNRSGEGFVLSQLAEAARDASRLEEAASLYERSAEMHASAGSETLAARARAHLVAVHRRRGRGDRARDTHHAAITGRPQGDLARAIADLHLAALELDRGDVGAAGALLEGSEPAIAASGEKLPLVRLQCERARAAIVAGGDPEPWLARARGLVRELGLSPESPAARDVAILGTLLSDRGT